MENPNSEPGLRSTEPQPEQPEQNYANQDGQGQDTQETPTSEVPSATGGPNLYVPSDHDRRRDAVYAAMNSFASHGCNDEQLISRARRIEEFVRTGV